MDTSISRMIGRPDSRRFADLARAAQYCAERRAPMRTTTVYAPDLRVDAGPSGLYLPALPGAPSLGYSSLRQFNGIIAGPGMDFLDDLPPAEAADTLNAALKYRAKKKVGTSKRHGFYFRPGDSEDLGEVRSVNGPDYTRVYDNDVLAKVLQFTRESGTRWDCPLPFNGGSATDDSQGTIFVGDTYSFVFQSAPDRPIDLGGRGGNGTGGTALYPMILVQNSETGHGKLRVRHAFYSHLCSNYMIWGLRDDVEIEAIHRGGAAIALMDSMLPELLTFADQSIAPVVRAVEVARGMFPYAKEPTAKSAAESAARQTEKSVADLAEEWLRKQSTSFTQPIASAAVSLALADSRSGSDGRLSLWDLVQGLTRAAQTIRHRDDRLTVEVAAGKLMAPAVKVATAA